MSFKRDSLHHLACAAAQGMTNTREAMLPLWSRQRALRRELDEIEKEIARLQSENNEHQKVWDVLQPLRDGAHNAGKPDPHWRQHFTDTRTKRVAWAKNVIETTQTDAELLANDGVRGI